MAGSVINPHFAYAVARLFHLAEVAGLLNPENPGIDANLCLPIFQLAEPLFIGVALDDFKHGLSVIHGLHSSNCQIAAVDADRKLTHLERMC